jgi:hypothetical protein
MMRTIFRRLAYVASQLKLVLEEIEIRNRSNNIVSVE